MRLFVFYQQRAVTDQVEDIVTLPQPVLEHVESGVAGCSGSLATTVRRGVSCDAPALGISTSPAWARSTSACTGTSASVWVAQGQAGLQVGGVGDEDQGS